MEKRKQDCLTLLPEGIDQKVMVMVKRIRGSGVVLALVLPSLVLLKSSWSMTGPYLKIGGTIELEKKCQSVSIIANLIDF